MTGMGGACEYKKSTRNFRQRILREEAGWET
jgi:hypothetical protein